MVPWLYSSFRDNFSLENFSLKQLLPGPFFPEQFLAGQFFRRKFNSKKKIFLEKFASETIVHLKMCFWMPCPGNGQFLLSNSTANNFSWTIVLSWQFFPGQFFQKQIFPGQLFLEKFTFSWMNCPRKLFAEELPSKNCPRKNCLPI